jgi:CubicO group peptidase (beta-lactamase class C family)
MRLVDAGVLSFDTPVAPIIDPLLKKMKSKDPAQDFDKLSDLWGREVSKVTVLDLLSMRSGVPDYDTATPSGKHPTDSFRAECYANPTRSYTPQALISVPWIRTGRLEFTPGVCNTHKYHNCYSSTNYVLLGLLLAAQSGADSWQDYSQAAALAPVLKDFSNLTFAVSGPPSAWTPVHGYDVTKYNGNNRSIDVAEVAGVFGGWTASDIVFSAADAAKLMQDVYGPSYKLLSKPIVDKMYAESYITGYGLSTFNLTRLTPNDVAYGHLGATYGYQSVVVYVPSLELSITIGTNIETDYQSQPADAFCSVYNTAKAIILGERVPHCTYSEGYWSGGCKCK